MSDLYFTINELNLQQLKNDLEKVYEDIDKLHNTLIKEKEKKEELEKVPDNYYLDNFDIK